MEVSHIVVKKDIHCGGMGRLWESRITKSGGGIFWEGGVDSGRAG